MRHVICLLLFAAFVVLGCSQTGPTAEDLAGQAAKSYYDRLLAGDMEGFLSGRAETDSLPDDYRRQLLTAYEQYKQQLEKLHGGIASVTVSNVRCDSTLQLMQAFLLLNFNDSTKEEIIVPMVQQADGQWRMR